VLAFVRNLSILTYLDRTCISRVQDIKLDLGLGDTHMGPVFGAFSIGYGLIEVPGVDGERVGYQLPPDAPRSQSRDDRQALSRGGQEKPLLALVKSRRRRDDLARDLSDSPGT
jgi:hypothetical protein